MKRNISINIRGIIFNVEEDGYKQLNEYLNAINKYFASYEDSREIIEDIEGRIAELFYARLDKQKQIITLGDVEELMEVMGSIDDFQAAEEDPAYQTTYQEPELEFPTEDDFRNGGNTAVQVSRSAPVEVPEELFESEKQHKEEYAYESETIYAGQNFSQEAIPEQRIRKLYRDTQRKVLGGVAAGVAHYLQIDPIWIRLVFIFLTTGLFFIPASLSIILVYAIMWSVIPKNDHLEENPRIRKLFRDPDKGVLGGVASGLAAYLGVSDMTVRLAFLVFGVVFGSGIFVYAILWLIIPEAKTITEKMQMEGQPINLSNIQHAIHDRSSEEEECIDKSRFHKVLLFPFRLLAVMLRHVAQFLRPIVGFTAEAVRIGGGLFLILLSTVLSVSWVAVLMSFLGWGWDKAMSINGVPAEVVRNSFDLNPIMIANAFIAVFIPSIFLGFLGIMVMRRQLVWNRTFGWSTLALWLLSLVGMGVSVAMNAREFSHDNEFIQEQTIKNNFGAFQVNENTYTQALDIKNKDKILTLDLDRHSDGNYREPRLTIEGYEGKQIKLEKKFFSQGRDYGEANINAQMIDYEVSQKGNVVTFGRRSKFKPHAKYRGQRVHLTLQIPYGTPFKMKRRLLGILRHTLYPHNFDGSDVEDNTVWAYTPKRLICLSRQNELAQNNEQFAGKGFIYQIEEAEDFSEIDVEGNFDIRLVKGEKDIAKVELFQEEDINHINLNIDGDKLELSSKRKHRNNEPIQIRITVPRLEKIYLGGHSHAKATYFKAHNMEIELGGASSLMIEGKVGYLEAEVKGNAKLSAYQLKTRQAEVDVSGNGEIELSIERQLDAQASGNGSVRYRGKPNHVHGESSGNGSINRE